MKSSIVIFLLLCRFAFAGAPAVDMNATLGKISALELLVKNATSADERFNVYRDILSNYALIYNQSQLGKDKTGTYKKKARDLCDQALAQKDYSPEQRAFFIHNKAQTIAAEDPKKGQELFTQALQLSTSYPGSSGALLILAEDAYEHDQYDQALKYYKLLHGRADVPVSYVEMKYAYSNLKTKHFAEAEKSFVWLFKNAGDGPEVDGAIEGLATATSFSKSETELVKLSENLFWSSSHRQIAFLKAALKKRWASASVPELKPFDKIFSVTADTQQMRQVLLDLFDIPAGTLKPAVLAAYLQRYQAWEAKKSPPENGVINKTAGNTGPMEAMLYQALAAGYANKKSGKLAPVGAKQLSLLAGFYLSFFGNTKNRNDVTLMRTDLCRVSGDFACLGKIANEAPEKSISNSLRLSLALEAALGGHSLKDVVKVKDQALLNRVAEEMKGEKLWFQVMPFLIDRELKMGDKERALKWAAELKAQSPKDHEAQQLYSLTLATQLREQVKTKKWDTTKRDLEALLAQNTLKPREQTELVGFVLANMLLSGRSQEAADIYQKSGKLLQNTPETRGIVKALMKNAIARGQWDSCLSLREKISSEAKDVEFEKVVCTLGRSNGRGELNVAWKQLRNQDIAYLADTLSLLAPEALIAETRWPNANSKEYQQALYFAFQNSQKVRLPALTESDYARVKLVAPAILKASQSTKAETLIKSAKFPGPFQTPKQFLKEVLSLSQKGEEASKNFKSSLSKLNARDQVRVLKALSDFELKLAQTMERGPNFAGVSAKEKEEYMSEMKSLADQHGAQAKEYMQAGEVKQQELKEVLARSIEATAKLNDPVAWRWPNSPLGRQTRSAVMNSRYLGAMLSLDFARPLFKITDEEYLSLRAMILLGRSRTDVMNQRVFTELNNIGQDQILQKYGLATGSL
jgi:hypothetical protein